MALRLLADDLTGAADSSAAFAAPDDPIKVVVEPGAASWSGPSAITVADANTRDLPVRDAAHELRRWLTKLDDSHEVFLKIDSMLRGNIASTVQMAKERFPRRPLVVAPALPSQKRITRNGRQWILDVHPAAEVRIRDRLGTASTSVEIRDVRRGTQELASRLSALWTRGDAALCDADTDTDLDIIVAASELVAPPLWVGTGGLAAALARAWHRRRGTTQATIAGLHDASVAADGDGTTVVIVGSASEAARRQLHTLAAATGVPPVGLGASLVALHPEMLRMRSDRLVREPRSGPLVLITVQGTYVSGHEQNLAANLARLVNPLVATASTVVATGGATARAVIDSIGVHTIEVLAEIEPGVVYGRPLDTARPHIVLKAGNFGDDGTLLRSIRALERVRSIHG